MCKHMQLMHDVYPISAKYVLAKMGFPIGLETRRLVGELTPAICSKLDKLIEERKSIGLIDFYFYFKVLFSLLMKCSLKNAV